MKDCIAVMTTKLLFENIVISFCFPRILMSNQGNHVVNETITKLTKVFHIHHIKRTSYHMQVNGIVEAFNKILEHALTKVFNVKRDDWHLRVSTVLWSYRTTCKKLTRHTPFKLVHGQEAIVPMEFLVPSLRIVVFIEMDDSAVEVEHMSQLLALDEDRLIVRF